MAFKYTKEWADEVIKLAKKGAIEGFSLSEEDRFLSLVEMPDCTNDARVVKTLIQAMFFDEFFAYDETVGNELSCIDYKVYFTALFDLIPKILSGKYPGLAVYLLDRRVIDRYTPDEWKLIENLIRKKLNRGDILKMISAFEDNPYFDLDSEDYPFMEFYKLLNKILADTE